MTFDPATGPREGIDFMPEPMNGDPLDSRWGGPVPWRDRLASFAALGTPEGPRPFEGLGKVDLAQGLPTSAVMPQGRFREPAQLPPPQPGLGEALIGGLTGLVTDIIPFVNEHNGGIKDVANMIGSAIDTPFRAIRPLEFLPGGGDVQDTFEALPEDDLKIKYESYVRQDPDNALRYMSQYLNSRGSEITELMGVSGVFAPAITPSLDFSEQLRRLVFGGLTVSSDAVARTYVGSSLRDIDGTLLDVADEELSHAPELIDLRNRYKAGDLTRDQLLDEITISRFRWTQDTGTTGLALSMLMDIATDPLTMASIGVGVAAKSAATGAVRAARIRVAQAVEHSTRSGEAAIAVAKRLQTGADDVAGRARTDITQAKYEWAKQNAPDLYQQGIDTLSRGQKTAYALDPIIQPAAKVALKIDNLFDWFGAGAVGRRLASFSTDNHLRGMVEHSGVQAVRRTQDFFTEPDKFSRYLGVASANNSSVWHQRGVVKQALAYSDEFRGSQTPTQAVRARMDVDLESRLKEEGRAEAARTTENFLPIAETGEAAVAASLATAKRDIASDYAAATGKSLGDVTKHLETATTRQLGFVHRILYGKQVVDFKEAQRAYLSTMDQKLEMARKSGDDPAVTGLTEARDNADHYTLISDRLLTKERAKAVLADISPDTDAAMAAARQAVEQFDTFDINWGGAAFDDALLRTKMKDFVETLLERDDVLVDVVKRDELGGNVAASLQARYEIGIRPDDVWGRVYKDGDLVGINTFVDVLDDADLTQVSRSIGFRDRLRAYMTESVTGARIHHEARSRFIRLGAKDYGLVKGDATRVFNAIQKEAVDRKVGPRGFTGEDLTRIVEDTKAVIDPEVLNRVGERGLLDLVLKSFEGDLMSVGLTSKASGLIKNTKVQRTNNLVGRISESLYPHWRFGLSPLFLAMELTEGPYFAILRGIKPGIKWSASDVRANSILRHMRTDSFATDQLERAQLAFGEGKTAFRIADRSGIRGRASALLPERLKSRNPLQTRVSGLYEYKELLYLRQAAKGSAERWADMMKKEYPEAFHRIELEFKTADPQRMWMKYMEDRGAFDASARHQLHLFDGAKPEDLGRMETIRRGDVASFHGYERAGLMREAIQNGSYTRDQFIDKYENLNLSRAYAERAYDVVSGLSEKEWLDNFREVATTPLEAEANISVHRLRAKKMKMPLEDYLNTSYSQALQSARNAYQVPGAAFRQTVRDSLQRNGMEVWGRGDDMFRLATTRMQALTPAPAPAAAPTPSTLARKSDGLLDPDQKAAPRRNASVDRDYEMMAAEAKAAFGDPEAALRAARWPDEMTTAFLGLTSKMPNPLVRSLLARSRGNVAKSVADARAELAARLNVALAASTAGPASMKQVARLLRDVQAEKMGTHSLAVLEGRLGSLLEGSTSAPKAADAWTQRVWGYPDDAKATGPTSTSTCSARPTSSRTGPTTLGIWARATGRLTRYSPC